MPTAVTDKPCDLRGLKQCQFILHLGKVKPEAGGSALCSRCQT